MFTNCKMTVKVTMTAEAHPDHCFGGWTTVTAMTGQDDSHLAIEFLVEPFVEGVPGPHVTAAVDAFAEHGVEVDMGPFSTSASAPIDDVVDAVAAMIRSSMRQGATSIRIQVGAQPSDLDGIGSLQNALNEMIRAAERDTGTPANKWDRAQKQAVVRTLHERGAFLLRGSVDDIARIMGVSRITVYNYLNAIEV